jgi:hypothetical protein
MSSLIDSINFKISSIIEIIEIISSLEKKVNQNFDNAASVLR